MSKATCSNTNKSKIRAKRCLVDELQNCDASHPKKNKLSVRQNLKGKDINDQLPQVIAKNAILSKGTTKQTVTKTKSNLLKNKNSNRSRHAKQKTNVKHVDHVSRVTKVIPIIQTRGMKAKATLVSQDEVDNFNKIDNLTSVEFLDGQKILEEGEMVDHDHDGVELSVGGSDLEEFPDPEPGQVLSSSEEEDREQEPIVPKKWVALKVVKVPNSSVDCSDRETQRSDKYVKFQQLRDDPDFRSFLRDMVGDTMAETSSGKTSKQQTKSSKKGTLDNLAKSQLNDNLDSGNVISQNQSPVTRIVQGQTLPSQLPPRSLVKSPSDMTLYSPGLRKANIEDINLIEKISNFVESIRLDSNRSASKQRLRTPVTDVRHVEQGSSSRQNSQM